MYKGVGWGASTFSTLTSFNNSSTFWSGFEYKYPETEIDWTNLYNFVEFVLYEDSLSFLNTYPEKFDPNNAVNYFIFLNLLRATDNAGKNIFIARYDLGEPYFYFPWDLDGTFGIIWDGSKENITNDILSNGFYARLLEDKRLNGFLDQLKRRWNKLRQNTVTLENLSRAFDTQYNYLKKNGVYERELLAWKSCAVFDENNLEYTYEWIENRLSYLDMVFNNPELMTTIYEQKRLNDESLNVYPNPAQSYFCVQKTDDGIKRLTLINMFGQTILTKSGYTSDDRINVSSLENGMYLLVADLNNGERISKKLIINRH